MSDRTLRLHGDDLLNVTITGSRYMGVYEGGSWIAWAGDGLPDAAFGSDACCYSWWKSEESALVGRGDTPNDALADLIARCRAAGAVEQLKSA